VSAATMQVYYADHHAVPLPAGHRFPRAKYALLKQWRLERKLLPPAELFPSDPAPLEAVRLGVVRKFKRGFGAMTREVIARTVPRR